MTGEGLHARPDGVEVRRRQRAPLQRGAHVRQPAVGVGLADDEGEVAAAQARVAAALGVALLAAQPLFEEEGQLLAARAQVGGIEGAQEGVGGDGPVEVVGQRLHARAPADAREQRVRPVAHEVRQRSARKASVKETAPMPRVASPPQSRSSASQPSRMSERCASST